MISVLSAVKFLKMRWPSQHHLENFLTVERFVESMVFGNRLYPLFGLPIKQPRYARSFSLQGLNIDCWCMMWVFLCGWLDWLFSTSPVSETHRCSDCCTRQVNGNCEGWKIGLLDGHTHWASGGVISSCWSTDITNFGITFISYGV